MQGSGAVLGNFMLLRDVLQTTSPAVLRLLMLQTHYRSPLDFSDARVEEAATAFDRIKAEIDKSGRPAADCVRLAVENSWSGFKAEWMPKAPEKRESWEDFKRNHGLQ